MPGINFNIYKQDGILQLLAQNKLKAFIAIVIFAPIAEEMMFRTLIKPRHIDIVLFMAVWPVFFLLRFVPIDVYWVVKLIFTAVFLFSVTYIGKQLIPEEQTESVRYWLNKFNIPVLVVTSLIFGFVHINNYVEEFTVNLVLFLLIFPRILAGFMLGWIKLKNKNLVWSMALHAMNNGFAFIFIIIFNKGI
ncbi:MAG: CPBP family intramembrane glutamic endopeptidase [Leeuwenhoekiella sp.]